MKMTVQAKGLVLRFCQCLAMTDTFVALLLLAAGSAKAQDVLPFPNPPMAGEVGPTMQ